MPFRKIGDGVLIDKTVNVVGLENVSIGNNVRVDAFSMIVATGQVEIWRILRMCPAVFEFIASATITLAVR